jgi:glycopeptide antibiotics resistance protein
MNLIDFIIVLILSAAIWLTAFAVKKGSIWKYVFGAAFTVYLMCAASITVFPIQFSPTIRAIFAEEGWKITDCIVLVPFKDGITADDILNAAMTVPFGVLITLIRKKTTWKNALAAGAAFGTATELLQLAIAAIQGFSFRYIDTADIICNLAGTMLGWMLTAMLIRFLQKSKPANVGEKSLYAYISEKCVKQ